MERWTMYFVFNKTRSWIDEDLHIVHSQITAVQQVADDTSKKHADSVEMLLDPTRQDKITKRSLLIRQAKLVVIRLDSNDDSSLSIS